MQENYVQQNVIITYLYFSRINYIKIVSLITLPDDSLSGKTLHGEHGIKHVRPLRLIQVSEQHIGRYGSGQSTHCFVVFWHHLEIEIDLINLYN